MNKIFKVIWNHTTQTWTAVDELASVKGKSKSVKLAAISTALLVAASGVEAANVVSEAGELGQLSIATNKVTNQFFGNKRYQDETGLSNNVAGAKVNAYDGIAIGNGAVSGSSSGTGGNGHVAIGLMAQASAGGANGQNAAVALGAYSLATGQGGTAIGAHSVADALNSTALGKVAKANGDGSTAVGTSTRAEWQGTALGNTAEALGFYATSIGVNSKANSHSSTSIGKAAVVSGKNAIGVGTETKVNGEGTVAVGSNTNVSSKNVSTLGSNITVPAGRDGAVVLGHGSDAGKDTDVIAVHSAKIGEQSKLTYTGFAGDLGGTNNKGKNKPAAKDKQGNFVSIGSEDDERQIKHVAAGRITEDSTDALNGSQLYSVAKTLGNAAEGLADTLGVDLNEDGTVTNKFSQPLTTAEGSNYTAPAAAGDVKTALTNLNNYVNAGWNVTASGNDYKNNVSVGHTVNFVGLGNVDVDGVNEENGVRTINISSDSPIDYATTKAEVDGKEVDVVKANDGKWYPKDKVDEDNNPKEGAASIPSSKILKKGAKLTDSDTENNPYEKGNAYTYDDKGNITATGYDKTKPESKDEITAGKHGVQLDNVGWATQPDQAVNKDQLDQTVNKSGFYVQQNGKSTLDGKTGSDKVSDTEKVTPNDVVNFVNGNGTVIKAVTKRDKVTGVDTTTISVDMDTKALSNDTPVVYTDAAGNKLKKDGGKFYPADAVNINGKYYPAGTTADNVAGAKEVQPVADVIASMNNPSSDAVNAGKNVTLTNVAPGANTYEFDKEGNPLVNINGKYYAQDDVKNGAPKEGAKEVKDDEKATDAEKDPYEKAATGLANLEGSKDSNALTVADAKKMGWVVSANGNDYADKVTNANEVRFNGKNGIKVTGETDEATGIRNINIELEKSDVVKAGEYKIGDKTYVNVDGKLYDKDSIDPKTDKPKADAKPSNYTVKDGKVMDNTDAANPKEVAGVDNGSNFVNGNTVYKAIQESGWTVGKAKDALANEQFADKDEKVNPNDEVRFADGKGITVKTATVDATNDKGEKQTTTVVKFDTDLPIDYANVKNEAGDNLKQANDGKWYKEADVNADGTLKPKDGKAPEAQDPVKTGATLSDGKSNATKPYKNEDVYTYTTDPKTGEVKATPKGYDAAKPENKDSIVKGKDGVQLNNVGWAENPDQAVNKDQLDQTVNKSGFFVQQNGKTTVENAANKEETDPAKSEKVTPNDVVNFVNGNGTVIKAVTKRDANGVDTTTVSVDVDTSKLNVPKGANTIAYNDKGEQIVKVDDKYYKPSDLTNGKPNTGAVEQKLGTPAADKPVDQAKNGLVDLANSNDGNAITVKDAQNLGWVVSTSDNKAVAPVKNADIVDFKAEAGTGITVKGESENGKMTVTVGNDYFKANVTDKTAKAAKATGPNSVAIGGNSDAAVENAVAIGNGATVGAKAAKGSVAIGAGAQAGKAHTGAYSLDPSATVAGKPSDATRVVSVGSEGNEAQIQNVAAGVVSEKSTDAVNGSQLHATNQSINRLGDTVNNIGGNVTRLSDKVDNMDRDYRAGIAGSNAAASLPQVYLPGKSMVAAAAGTFKGQNALAVGYSSISDNGKLIWKAQANLNSRADVGVGVGMGYLW